MRDTRPPTGVDPDLTGVVVVIIDGCNVNAGGGGSGGDCIKVVVVVTGAT